MTIFSFLFSHRKWKNLSQKEVCAPMKGFVFFYVSFFLCKYKLDNAQHMLSCNLCSCWHHFALSSMDMLDCCKSRWTQAFFTEFSTYCCLCGFQTTSGFWHSAKKWRALQHHQMHHLMDRHPFHVMMSSWISLNLRLAFSLESGCFCDRFCLDMWSLDSADRWVTQVPKLKASRRFCVNGGTSCRMFFFWTCSFTGDVHKNCTYLCCYKVKLWRDVNWSTSVNTLQLFGCHKGRIFFSPKCASLCWPMIEEIEDTKDALKPKTSLLLNILVAGSFYSLERDERWTAELLQVSQDSLQEKPHDVHHQALSSSQSEAQWITLSVINVFCLPVMLTALMTINAEYALYSTFFRLRNSQQVNVKLCFCHVYPYWIPQM